MKTVRLQSEMSYEEAVQVLGFREGDWISPHLPAFQRAEEKLKELIESAGDAEQSAAYREELARLNEAVRVIDAERKRERRPSRRSAVVLFLVSLFIVGGLVSAAWLGNEWVRSEKEAARDREVESLLATGRIAVEKRRWPEAIATFSKALELKPGSERAQEGLQSVEEGKEQERRQAIGFLFGTAQAAMEARNWDEADEAVRKVMAADPGNTRISGMLEKIREGRTHDKVVRILESAEEAIREEQWEQLGEHGAELASLAPDHADLPRIRELTSEGMRLLADRREKARELYMQALEFDDGTYSDQALELLREAMRLDLQVEYQALYRKISSHARTLQVPEQFETISEALASARTRDKLMVGEGTFEESLMLPAGIDLEGAGPGKTIITCAGADASVITVGKQAGGSRLSGLTLRQSGMSLTEERFPVVAVDGVAVTIEDCWIEHGCGHGIAVLGGSSAVLRSVRVTKCGWDGLAVSGLGSKAQVIEGRFEQNLHHGVDAWDGGAVKAVRTRCSGNGLAGAVFMSTGVMSSLGGCASEQNRELGVLVANGAQVALDENLIQSNLLGGVLVRDPGTEASLYKNRILKNGEAGIVVDRESTLVRFEENETRDNAGQQVQLKAVLEAVLEEGG